jgi:glycerol-3-phosphate acyltransferase PlsY
MIYAATLIFAALFGYLLGSIPFGLVLTKAAGLGDIRKIGSGNIGATNVLRTGNKPLALATLLLDSGKGAIAVIIMGTAFDFNAAMLAGLFALLGHCYPVWLNFKGGKGVATTLGTLIALAPLLGGLTCVIWMVTALLSRISSLSALVAVGFSPLIAHYLYDNSNLSGLCAMIAALVYMKHRENIKRLFAGQEPRIGKKK